MLSKCVAFIKQCDHLKIKVAKTYCTLKKLVIFINKQHVTLFNHLLFQFYFVLPKLVVFMAFIYLKVLFLILLSIYRPLAKKWAAILDFFGHIGFLE